MRGSARMRGLQLSSYLMKKFPLLLVSNVGLLFISGTLESLSVFSLVPLVDFLVNPDLSRASGFTKRVVSVMDTLGIPATQWSLMGICVLLVLLTSGFSILNTNSMLRTKYAVVRDMILGTYDDFFGSRWYFFSSGSQGTMLNTLTREIGQVGDAFGGMASFLVSITRVLFYFAVPLYISWQVTLVSAGSAFLLAAPFMLLTRVSYRLGLENTATGNRLTSILHESLASAKVIMGFGNQGKSREWLRSVYERHFRTSIVYQTLNIAIPHAYKPLGMLVLMMTFLVARRWGVSLAETAVMLFAILQTIPMVANLVAQRTAFDNFFPSFEQVTALRSQAKALRQTSGSRPFTDFSREITLEHVTFAYPGQEPILQDVTLRIAKGLMVAVVGQSGAGKSTLIDVIMAFNDPLSGRVLFDGVPFPEFDINSYRKRIGYVPQDSILFNMSIRDNLLWAKEDATEAELQHAARQANAEEFIEELPEKYDTVVGDRGVRLSGGQIQRIALARAILRKPTLLILDEATSALDTHSERLIQSAIETIAKETTIVVIAHRLSTIVNADKIVVLQKGRLVEEGNYKDLMQQGEHFRQMIELQSLSPTPEGKGIAAEIIL